MSQGAVRMLSICQRGAALQPGVLLGFWLHAGAR